MKEKKDKNHFTFIKKKEEIKFSFERKKNHWKNRLNQIFVRMKTTKGKNQLKIFKNSAQLFENVLVLKQTVVGWMRGNGDLL